MITIFIYETATNPRTFNRWGIEVVITQMILNKSSTFPMAISTILVIQGEYKNKTTYTVYFDSNIYNKIVKEMMITIAHLNIIV